MRVVGDAEALTAGRPAFEDAVVSCAHRLAASDRYDELLVAKHTALEADTCDLPLDAYRVQELAEMRADIFDDRLLVRASGVRVEAATLRRSATGTEAEARPAAALIGRRAG